MAATGGLWVAWTGPVPGREKEAIGLYAEFVAFVSGQVAAGNVESFEPVLLRPHGDLNGFVLIRGEPSKLDAMTHTDGWLDVWTKCILLLQGTRLVYAELGSAIQKELMRAMKVMP